MANNIDIIVNLKNLASRGLESIKKGLFGLGTSADKTRAKLNKFNKSAGLFKATIATIGALLAGKLAVSMLKTAGAFEQWQISFETMLGSAKDAKVLMEEIKDFALKTPFELPGLVQSSKQLLAFGIEQKKVIPTLKMLGDVASGLDVPIERLILNFGQVKAQAKLTGRELRDFAIAGVPLLKELSKNLGVSEADVQKLVSAGRIGFKDVEKAFASMSGEGGKFFNLMGRQASTLTTKWTNFKIALQLLSLRIMDYLTPAIKSALTVLEQLTKAFTELIPEAKKGLDKLAADEEKYKNKIIELEKWVNYNKKKLLEKNNELAKWFIKKELKETEEKLNKEKDSLEKLQKEKKNLLKQNQSDTNQYNNKNKLSTIDFVDKAIDQYERWKTETEAIRKLSLQDEIDYLNSLKEKHGLTAEDLEDINKKIYEKRKDLNDNLQDLGRAYANDLKDGLSKTVEIAVNGAGGITEKLKSALSVAFGPNLGSFISGAFGQIITNGILSIITGIFGSNPVKTVAEYAEEAFDRLVNRTNKALEDLGKEKTVAEKRVDILKTLQETYGKEGIIPKEYLAALGLTEQITIQKAIDETLKKIQGINDEDLVLRKKDVEELKKTREGFIKLGELYQSYLTSGKETSRVTEMEDLYRKLMGKELAGNVGIISAAEVMALNKKIAQDQEEIDLKALDLLNENLDINNEIRDLNKEEVDKNLPEYHSGGIVKPKNGKKEVRAMMLAGENVFTPKQNDLMISNLNAMNSKLDGLLNGSRSTGYSNNSGGDLTIPISVDGNVITKFVVKKYNKARQINTISKIVGT